MERELSHIAKMPDDDAGTLLLIDMTNHYIDYRNQIYDTSHIDGVLENEDYDDIRNYDNKIQEVLEYLGMI